MCTHAWAVKNPGCVNGFAGFNTRINKMKESEFVDMVWKALLNQCASDPKQAIRLVMVQKDDVKKAMSVVFRELPISNKGDNQ
jgi:hypothetical protein